MNNLEQLSQLTRYWSITSTTQAGSGHPTSSLSATDLMVTLLFGGTFQYDCEMPEYHNNDRLIFSKGHASPLYYSLWAVADQIPEDELMTLRDFDSRLEGHPTMNFPFTEAATGSLGQGLSVGVGMALHAKREQYSYYTYVLLGDSELAEGSVWEAFDCAAYYGLSQLVAIVDINRLGQRGETMYGHNIDVYKAKCQAFGWQVYEVDGHNHQDIQQALDAVKHSDKPVAILAKTYKGKGVSFLENKEGWHGKALSEEECQQALQELGEVDTTLRGYISAPEMISSATSPERDGDSDLYPRYDKGEKVATRKAYGEALSVMASGYTNVVALDAEVSNSTKSGLLKDHYPHRFLEMFIAEQNMVGVALGLSRRGQKPFVSTFSAFFTRAFDQIRMAQYSEANIAFVGSHCGVSIGQDGSSQMGLEDIAQFRSIREGVVLYPADAVSTLKLVEKMYYHTGISYLRTTRMDTPVIYDEETDFVIGGSKVLKQSDHDQVTLIGAGVTLFECRQAAEELEHQGIQVRVIDLYSIQPLDLATLHQAARETQALITVEDHYPAGGIGEAVRSGLESLTTPVYSLAVTKMPRSGTPEELLAYEEIDTQAIVSKVKDIM